MLLILERNICCCWGSVLPPSFENMHFHPERPDHKQSNLLINAMKGDRDGAPCCLLIITCIMEAPGLHWWVLLLRWLWSDGGGVLSSADSFLTCSPSAAPSELVLFFFSQSSCDASPDRNREIYRCFRSLLLSIVLLLDWPLHQSAFSRSCSPELKSNYGMHPESGGSGPKMLVAWGGTRGAELHPPRDAPSVGPLKERRFRNHASRFHLHHQTHVSFCEIRTFLTLTAAYQRHKTMNSH